MILELLAQGNLAVEPGITIGTGAAGLMVGIIAKHYWPKNGRYTTKELCNEKHKNLEGWMKRIDCKLDDALNNRR